MSGWRTIDSAPKDGTRFLVYGGGGPERIGYFDEVGQFRTAVGRARNAPKLWHPLPPPPETE